MDFRKQLLLGCVTATFFFTACGTFVISPAYAQEYGPRAKTWPSPQVEARTAAELWRAVVAVSSSKPQPPEDMRPADLDRIAIALARLGRVERALETVNLKEDLSSPSAPSKSDFELDARSDVLRWAARRRCIAGNIDGALALIPAIQYEPLRIDALVAVVCAHLRREEFTEARDVLYRASSLLSQKFSSSYPEGGYFVRLTAYTAFLLNETGDRAAADRVFQRAKKLARQTDGAYEQLARRNRERSGRRPANPGMKEGYYANRGIVATYLLKSGRVDEWFDFAKEDEVYKTSGFVRPLLRWGRADLAEKLVATGDPSARFYSLLDIAQWLGTTKGDRQAALRVLRTADETLDSVPHLLSGISQDREAMSVLPNFMRLSLYAAYDRLQETTLADDQWEKVSQNLGPSALALLEIVRSTAPYRLNGSSGTPITSENLRQIAARIEPLEVQARELERYSSMVDSGMLRLARTAFRMGDRELAGEILQRLDQTLLFNQPVRTEMTRVFNLIQVARLWRELGEESRMRAVIRHWEGLLLAEEPLSEVIASEMAANGFVAESVRLMQARPVSAVSYDSPYRLLGRYRPTVFPESVKQIKPIHVRIQELDNLTTGLTDPIFEAEGERGFVLDPGYYVVSGKFSRAAMRG